MRHFKQRSSQRAVLAVCLGAFGGAVGAQERLSPLTKTVFIPDGDIREFIHFHGDSQEYFIADPLLEETGHPDFGAIKAGAILTGGVLVGRDAFPVPSMIGPAGPSGFRDNPAVIGKTRVPTGFNVGRVFASYNPLAYRGEGAYFLAMDISAPAALDTRRGTQPVAFDLDGDGSLITVNDAPAGMVSEVPTDEDTYRFVLDTDQNGINDVRITVGERPGSLPPGTVEIGSQMIPNLKGVPTVVRRWVQFEWLQGVPPASAPDLARIFLDANDDGVLTANDVGVGSDVEIVVRHVRDLPNNSDPAGIRVVYLADSFDDEPLGGGGEDSAILAADFPFAGLEIETEVRCAEEDAIFGPDLDVPSGAKVDFRVTILHTGGISLNELSIEDTLFCVLPGMLIPLQGTCQVLEAPPTFPRVPFCEELERSLAASGNATVFVEDFGFDAGEQIVFTFRARALAPLTRFRKCTNSVAVSSRPYVNQILPVFEGDPTGDGEEEHCITEACCKGIAGCVPNDKIGDVADERLVVVGDELGVVDTLAEMAVNADDNIAAVRINTTPLQCLAADASEACCLRFGSSGFRCVNTSPDVCLLTGGRPRGSDSRCLGDGNDDGIDDACGQCVSDAHCNDGEDCNGLEFCDKKTLMCLAQDPLPAETPCGDPSDSDCDNPDTCNGKGACVPNLETDGTPCLLDANDCTSDFCTGGVCAHPPRPSGTPCDDGLFCNGVDRCADGQCSAMGPMECDDGLFCTMDMCNEETDSCVHVDVNTLPCGKVGDFGVCPVGDCINGICSCEMIPDCNGCFIGECAPPAVPPFNRWSCFDNWTLGGKKYPDNFRYGPDTYRVTLDIDSDDSQLDDVFLNVSVTIDSLRLIDGSILRVTQEQQGAKVPDLNIVTAEGLRNEGNILVAHDRRIDVAGPVVIGPYGVYRSDPDATGEVQAVLKAESILVLEGPIDPPGQGMLLLDQAMEAATTRDMTFSGLNSKSCNEIGKGRRRAPTGRAKRLRRAAIGGDPQIRVGRHFSLLHSVDFEYDSMFPLTIGGDFINTSRYPECFACSGVRFGNDVSHASQTEHYLEVGGVDRGPIPEGFVNNFAIGRLEVAAGQSLTLANREFNTVGTQPCSEALYVDELVLEPGSNLIIENCRLYARSVVNQGGKQSTEGCGKVVIVRCRVLVEAGATVLVAAGENDRVNRYFRPNGGFLGALVGSGTGGLDDPRGMTFGPDGHFYVSSFGSNQILRYQWPSGAFLGVFVRNGAGGLAGPTGLAFGADGHLYVCSFANNGVIRYDGRNGSYLDTFVQRGLGGLNRPTDLVFGPDGHLYVSSFNNDSIKRYSGISGGFLGSFVPNGSGGLDGPSGLTFGPDGNLYVSSFNSDAVHCYHGLSGGFLRTFVRHGLGALDGPTGLTFGPDGTLYVSSFNTDRVNRYHGRSGGFLGTFAAASTGLNGPRGVIVAPLPVCADDP